MTAQIWTAAQVRALGVRTDGVTACRLIYGVGRTRAYEILRSGEADFRVIKVPGSNRYVVPTSEILRILFGAAAGGAAAGGEDAVELATWGRAG